MRPMRVFLLSNGFLVKTIPFIILFGFGLCQPLPASSGLECIRFTLDQVISDGVSVQPENNEAPPIPDALQPLQAAISGGEFEQALRMLEKAAGPWAWAPLESYPAIRDLGEQLGRAFLAADAPGKARWAFSLVARAGRNPVDYLYALADDLDAAARAALWNGPPYLLVVNFNSPDAAPPQLAVNRQERELHESVLAQPETGGVVRMQLGPSREAGAHWQHFNTPGFYIGDWPFGVRMRMATETPQLIQMQLKYWIPLAERGGEIFVTGPRRLADDVVVYDSATVFPEIQQEIRRRQGALNYTGTLINGIGIAIEEGEEARLAIEAVEIHLPEDWQQIQSAPVPSRVAHQWEFVDPENPGWASWSGIEKMTVRDGVLSFLTGEEPAAIFTALPDLNADYINAVEIRMRVQPWEPKEQGTFSWSFPGYNHAIHGGNPFGKPREYRFSLKNSQAFETYRINLHEGSDLDWNRRRGAFSFTPTKRAGRTVEIDSIAFLRLHGGEVKTAANIVSGREQRGVETRSSLYTTQNSALRFPLTIGAGAYFETGAAVVDYPPQRADDFVEFHVRWQADGGEDRLLARRLLKAEKPPARFGWEDFRVDLGLLAGQQGVLTLATQWSRNEQREPPQLAAAWGNPRVWQQDGKKKPNIIIICADTLRADALGCYGYKQDISPAIDRLAASSTVFDNAFSAAPWTWHSVTGMFTSLYVRQFSSPRKSFILDSEFVTFPEILRDAGYATAAFSLNTWVSEQTGLGQGFDVFLDLVSRGASDMDWARSDQVTEPLLHWLEENRDKPFFAYVHYLDPHAPHHPPAWTRGRYARGIRDVASEAQKGDAGSISFRLKQSGNMPVNEASIAYLRQLYDEEILGVDEHIGRIMDSLDLYGLAENTVVVFYSDHGEEFMERGFLGHGGQLTPEQLHVPLIIRAPGLTPARRSDLASLLDIAPTLLSLAGCEPLQHARGVNLFDAAQQRGDDGFLFAEMLDYKEPLQYAVITPEWHFTQWVGAQQRAFRQAGNDIELYQRTPESPLENMAESHSGVLQALDAKAQALIAALDAAAARPENAASDVEDMGLSDAQIEKLQALGYLE